MGFPIGNQYAAKAKRITKALERAIEWDNGARLESGLNKLMDAFAAGEPWAIEQVFNRVEGKPAQAIQLEDEDGKNVFTGIRMVVIRNDVPQIVTSEPATIEQPAQLIGEQGANACG